MKIYDVIIIGAGASGLMSAINSSENTLVLEANQKVGKKLLATGNGRCNLSNENVSEKYYHGETKGLGEIFKKYDCKKIKSVFHKMGLLTVSDQEGRVYPKNLQAAAVVKTLTDVCSEKKIQIICDCNIVKVLKTKEFFKLISSNSQEFYCKNLIMSVGGKASPKLSGCKDCYNILKQLGHTTTKISPVLTGFTSEEKFLKALSGVRTKATVKLYEENKFISQKTGEVMFSNNAVSGICVFDLSIYSNSFKNAKLSLDLCTDMDCEEIINYFNNLKKNRPNLKAGDYLNGLVNMKLGFEIIKLCKINHQTEIKNLKENEVVELANKLKSFLVKVNGLRSWDDAQLTAGGVPLTEININTMESKICKNLFITGEVLNIHGDCGGFNLHFAWVSGIIAGKCIKDRNNK